MTAGATGSSPSTAESSAQTMISSPFVSDHGRGELADAQLRALQVGDERDRAADLGGDLTDEPRALGVILVLSVRQVQANGVDAGGDQLVQALPRVRCRTKRRHDLRPTLFHHGTQST